MLQTTQRVYVYLQAGKLIFNCIQTGPRPLKITERVAIFLIGQKSGNAALAIYVVKIIGGKVAHVHWLCLAGCIVDLCACLEVRQIQQALRSQASSCDQECKSILWASLSSGIALPSSGCPCISAFLQSVPDMTAAVPAQTACTRFIAYSIAYFIACFIAGVLRRCIPVSAQIGRWKYSLPIPAVMMGSWNMVGALHQP